MIRERLRGLREKIVSENLDAFVINRSVRYFGLPSGCLVVPAQETPIVLSSRVDFELLRRGPFKDVRTYCEVEVPSREEERLFVGEFWKFLLSCLQEIKARRIGIEHASLEMVRKLGAEGVECLELPALVEDLVMVKLPHEIELLKRSARIAEAGMKRASELIEPGRTEREIAAEAEYLMRKSGSEGTPFPTIVASGANSWIPHATTSDRVLQKGDHVVVDLGAIYQGYCSDLTRTFRVGKEGSPLIEKVRTTQEQIREEVRGGAKAGDLDSLARKKLGKDAKFFAHGLGHGVGLRIHERPSLGPGSKDVVREGMVITLEPGLYVPKRGGARWEDMFLVKKDGCLPLTGHL
ncbi:MAG: M24 family metallopeptidase [Candidatus Hadarchaeales archaeon]